MGLLSKLKSLLGMEDESRSAGSGVDVTVEREPSADAESERAVKESTDGTEDGNESDEDVDEPVASETDAAASTESLVDEEHADDSTRAAEPAEAAVAEDTGTDDVDAEDVDADDGQTDAGTDDAADGNSESVSTVKGIGPAYANRLEDAGVETVADLAAADPDELAERVDLSSKRVGRWVDSAKDRN